MAKADHPTSETRQDAARKRRGRVARAVPVGRFVPHAARPIDRQVYEHLRHILASGAVAPGQKLSTRALAEAFGLSAMPTRVALKQLAAEGVLIAKPRSGFEVAPASADAYRELLAIRVRLEGLAVREAASRMTSSSLRAAETFHRMIAAHNSPDRAYLELNFAFHFEIYRAAEMPRLLDMIETLWTRIGPFLNYPAKLLDFSRAIANHQRILDALHARDGEGAEAALRQDLEEAAEVILPRLG